MDNHDIAHILRAVARDLDTVADQLTRTTTPADPVAMLAVATRGRDDHTRRVACANIAVAEAIAGDYGPDPFDALGALPSWPGPATR